MMHQDCIRDRYLHGHCMVLAATLSNLYDLPIVGIFDEIWDTIPRHVGVRMSDGRLVDARGIQSEENFTSGYRGKGARIAPVSIDRLKEIWGKRVDSWTACADDLRALGFDKIDLKPFL